MKTYHRRCARRCGNAYARCDQSGYGPSVLATVAYASRRQAEAAIQAAKRAQPGWEALGWHPRAAMLEAIADRMEDRSEDFVDAMVAEQGKPRQEAVDETTHSIAFIRHFARLELPDQIIPMPTSGKVELRQRALGWSWASARGTSRC
ncbi:aldehyde dehydrogenase family protein [Cupriavidus basilensis]